MFRLNLYTRLGASDRNHIFDPQLKFVTSPFLRSPFAFAALRLLVAVYILVTLIITLIWKSVSLHSGQSYLSYFTYLTYIGLCAYYFASGTQTFNYALNFRKSGSGAGYALQRWPRFLQALHVILQSTILTFPFVVTIVFWALLADPSTFDTAFSAWSNISVHAFNSVFALIEVFLTNSPPPPWITLAFTILCLVGYIGVAYITHHTQGFYTYSFLDPKKQGGKLAAYIVGIALAQVIVFCLVRGAMVLRQRWAERTGRVMPAMPTRSDGESGRGNSSGETDIQEGWEEVESPTTSPHKTLSGDSDVSKVV